MPSYDFRALSPYDFEHLVRDLLQKSLGVRLESFKRGKDGGIDLRYLRNSRSTVVQCKHYVDSGFPTLLRHIRKDEVPKVRRLKPHRYILATSVGLTPGNKNSLANALAPHCRGPEDILGVDDLNNFLGIHPEVEKAHFKLWLTSSSVLQALLHSNLINESAAERERIARRTRLYVQHRSFFRATEILEKNHYCIIAGQPGIGKTTLAEMLSVAHLGQGYQVVIVSDDIRDAFRLYDSQTKQLFVYDDFLGTTALEAKLHKNEEHALLRLIEVIAQAPTSRLILTTREYILNQAKFVHEKLSAADNPIARCTITVDSYTPLQRAAVLHNHTWFSPLGPEYKAALLAKRNYRKIISHANYVPRIIEWMTDISIARSVPPARYVEHFIHSLDHPHELWRHPYDNQLSERARHLLLVVLTSPNVTTGDLERAFESYRTGVCGELGAPREANDFRQALRELEDAFLAVESAQIWDGSQRHSLLVRFHHPSISDFMEAQALASPRDLERLVETAIAFEQVVRLWALARTLPGGPSNALVEQLWNSADKLFAAPSIALMRSSSVRRMAPTYWRHSESSESRLHYLVGMHKVMPSPRASEILNARFAEYLKSIVADGRVDSAHARQLLNGLYRGSPGIALNLSALTKAVKDRVLRGSLDLADLELLRLIATIEPHGFSESDGEVIEGEVAYRIDEYLEEADTGDLDEISDTLEGLEGELSLDLSIAREQVDERRAKLEAKSRRNDDLSFEFSGDLPSTEQDDEAIIDGMFDVFGSDIETSADDEDGEEDADPG